MADLKSYSGSLSDYIMWINVQTGLKLYAGWQDKFIKHMQYLTFLKCWHLIYVWTRWSLFASLVPLQLLEVSFFLSENCEHMYWFFCIDSCFSSSHIAKACQSLKYCSWMETECLVSIICELNCYNNKKFTFFSWYRFPFLKYQIFFSDNTKSVSG